MKAKLRYFKRRYKYQLSSTYTYYVVAFPDFKGVWYRNYQGEIAIWPGYAWDGASGPARDTPATMKASLIHDVMYQAIRQGHLSQMYKDQADQLYRDMLICAGMPKWRARLHYHALAAFGGPATSTKNKKRVIEL